MNTHNKCDICKENSMFINYNKNCNKPCDLCQSFVDTTNVSITSSTVSTVFTKIHDDAYYERLTNELLLSGQTAETVSAFVTKIRNNR